MAGPLAGITVLEAGHMLAGPYCGMLLADLGAEVIKIEPPEGDIGRRVSPHTVAGHNAYFASLNRTKKSVVLDLASDHGQHALHALAARAHALVANLRPGAIRKLGLTYEVLKATNPKLVCVALTGFGLEGTHADRPAYDYVVQAMAGVMAITGEPGAPPAKTGYSAVDNSAGIMGALGLLAKIVEGKGGQVDVSMHDTMLSQLNYLAGAWLNAGEPAARMARSSHPYIVPAQVFETKDGWLVLFVSHDEFWRRFCTEARKPGWIADPRYATMAARRGNRDALLAELEPLLRSDTSESWMQRLAPLGVVAAPVERMERALESDLVRERGMVAEIACGPATLRVVGNPIRIDGQVTAYAPPPRLGEHTSALLAPSQLLDRALARERRSLGRAISAIEDATPEGEAIVRALASRRGRAHVVGVTGPPGAGKSTLVGALARVLLARGQRVAVIAVDPSSPFSGGALLGDRVRMADVQQHDEVYIRSLASRGHHGGLTRATRHVAALLSAAGFDTVLVETVGAGQSDVEIAELAQTRLVVCPPGLGDDVQALKAGILEIADLFVINKADLPGADRTEKGLASMLQARSGAQKRDILRTAATTGDGVEALTRWIEDRRMAWGNARTA